MRKVVFALLAALVAVLPGEAVAQGISLGVKGGLNLANFGGDVEDTDMRTGLAIGGFVNFDLGAFSIQPEAYFSQKGASLGEFAFEDVSVKSDWNTSYLEVPVLARLGLGVPGAPVRPVLFAGPAVGILLSSKVKGEVGGISAEEDVKDDSKSLDFGGVIGAGVEFGNFQLDARYTLGLTNFVDGDDVVDVKNRTISILLGYRLPFGM